MKSRFNILPVCVLLVAACSLHAQQANQNVCANIAAPSFDDCATVNGDVEQSTLLCLEAMQKQCVSTYVHQPQNLASCMADAARLGSELQQEYQCVAGLYCPGFAGASCGGGNAKMNRFDPDRVTPRDVKLDLHMGPR